MWDELTNQKIPEPLLWNNLNNAFGRFRKQINIKIQEKMFIPLSFLIAEINYYLHTTDPLERDSLLENKTGLRTNEIIQIKKCGLFV